MILDVIKCYYGDKIAWNSIESDLKALFSGRVVGKTSLKTDIEVLTFELRHEWPKNELHWGSECPHRGGYDCTFP